MILGLGAPGTAKFWPGLAAPGTMEGGGGAMGMKYLDAIDIPADKPARLNPAGLHVWLADLNQPLKAGQTFTLTLKFEKAGERQIAVSVLAPAAASPMSGMRM